MLPFVQIFFSILFFIFYLFLCSYCCFSNIFRSSGSKKKGSVKGKKGKGKIGGNTKNRKKIRKEEDEDLKWTFVTTKFALNNFLQKKEGNERLLQGGV